MGETIPFIVTEPEQTCPELQLTLEACDKALRTAEAELDARKKQYELLQEYARRVEEQRDRAYERIDEKSLLPWWGWMLVGGAATTILIRGVK